MLRVLLLFVFGLSVSQAELINQRLPVSSDILDRPHELLVYTPPSYDFDEDQRYPVLYLMDGEYNFNYVTGLIELWSNISPRQPEMIVVGISGYDSAYYRQLTSPPWDDEGQPSGDGSADKMMKAIVKEIKPAISKQFRTNDLEILSGHSMGGLFTTYAALTYPEAFDYFIAISPSLWWQQQRMKTVMADRLSHQVPEVNLYMSLANEQGMGVHGFMEMVQAERREPLNLEFKHFPEESHGSVGLPTYEWALGDIFENYKLEERYFENGQAVADYASQLQDNYGYILPVNAVYLRNSCYAHCRGEEHKLLEIDQALAKHFPHDVAFFRVLVAKQMIAVNQLESAESWLTKAEEQAPQFVEVHHGWYLWHQANGDDDQTAKALNKVRNLIKSQQLRQWQINELYLPGE